MNVRPYLAPAAVLALAAVTPAAAPAVTPAATPAWATAKALQTPTPYRIIAVNGDTFMHAGHQWTVTSIGQPEADPSGGWSSMLTAQTPTLSVGGQAFLVGVLPGAAIDDVVVLAGPEVTQGQITANVIRGTMIDGHVGAVISFTGGGRVTLDGVVVMESGTLLPGTQFDIVGFSGIRPTSTAGRAFVNCQLRDTFDEVRDFIVELPSMQLVLGEGSLVPNAQAPIEVLENVVRTTRSGDHWWTNVRFEGVGGANGLRGVVVDGEIFELGGGSRLVQGDPLPDYVGQAGTWQALLRFLMNDAGDWTARGSSAVTDTIVIRNGRVTFAPDPTFTANVTSLDVDGMAIGTFLNDIVAESSVFLDRPALVDRDGDGLSDPSYLWNPQTTVTFAGTNEERVSVYRTIIETPTGGATAILSTPKYRVDELQCPSVPNSTGRPGGLAAAGRSAVDENRLELLGWDLPRNSFGFFIISMAPGLVVGPGGSQGNLCLSGDIGRFTNQIYFSGQSGRASATVDLAAIPQPMGAVAGQAGETWYAQGWYRDSVAGVATSNFTSGIKVTLD